MLSILVVDDEADVLKVLAKELTAAGYKVVTATTAKEGIQKAQETLPDLILMDLLLPDMGGADAVKIIKGYAELKDKPVLFLTAMVTPSEDKGEALSINVGEDWYETVAKPYDKADLLSKIQKKIKAI